MSADVITSIGNYIVWNNCETTSSCFVGLYNLNSVYTMWINEVAEIPVQWWTKVARPLWSLSCRTGCGYTETQCVIEQLFATQLGATINRGNSVLSLCTVCDSCVLQPLMVLRKYVLSSFELLFHVHWQALGYHNCSFTVFYHQSLWSLTVSSPCTIYHNWMEIPPHCNFHHHLLAFDHLWYTVSKVNCNDHGVILFLACVLSYRRKYWLSLNFAVWPQTKCKIGSGTSQHICHHKHYTRIYQGALN